MDGLAGAAKGNKAESEFGRYSAPSNGYRPISDYGVIGDCYTAALISSDGSIDWYCPGRFDEPAIFSAILDRERGGSWRVGPREASRAGRQDYLPQTNVLVSTFETPGGAVEVVDLAPITDGRTLIRKVRALRGEVEVESKLDIRPQYGLTSATVGESGEVRAGQDGELLGTAGVLRPKDGFEQAMGAYFRRRMRAGESLYFILKMDAGRGRRMSHAEVEQVVSDTVSFWQAWTAQCTYQGPYRPAVQRSALALKLLTHAPTGALLAAATTSLPEWIPGERNWDYRYSWLRDSSMMATALCKCGFRNEAVAYLRWLRDRAGPRILANDFAIVYTLDGNTVGKEQALEFLEGYRGCRPVRVGNDARHQVQLDVYGDILEAISCIRESDGSRVVGLDDLVERLADRVVAHWAEPDSGLWEMRTTPRHFVYSKVMCAVALKRAIEILPRSANVDRRRRALQSILKWLETEGFHSERHIFTQAEGFAEPDASHLRFPSLPWLSVSDARLVNTFDLTVSELGVGDLLYRYPPHESDGVEGREGAFLITSFWQVEGLVRLGRRQEAVDVFEKVLGYASPLGLFAEEVHPVTGEMLGNFPQGYSHLGLINAALAIGEDG